MKLWLVAAPWDHHKRAAILVLAEDAEGALAAARKVAEDLDEKDDTYGWRAAGYSSLSDAVADDHWGLRWTPAIVDAVAVPVDGNWYANEGCDC